jgi:hypothetical protein
MVNIRENGLSSATASPWDDVRTVINHRAIHTKSAKVD